MTTMRAKGPVGIIMGSESDLPTMRPAAEALDELGVGWEMTVVSAHRTPGRLVEWAEGAKDRGIRVVVAGAGGAAHLPGMVASMTPLPVIGVPVANGPIGGVDALLSIVQMPPGVPVATVAIGGARNAGILAAQMLGIADPAVRERVEELKRALVERVDGMVERVESITRTGLPDPSVGDP